jgi:hypothetical protein
MFLLGPFDSLCPREDRVKAAFHWGQNKITPIILTREAEIRKIKVQSQPRQIVRETLF